jgi:hypothetical protein
MAQWFDVLFLCPILAAIIDNIGRFRTGISTNVPGTMNLGILLSATRDTGTDLNEEVARQSKTIHAR